jgi:hypothetical protein
MLASNRCQANAQNQKNQKLFDKLNRSREETTSSFFLKKISNFENKGFGVRFIFNPKTAFTLKVQK